jgi:hypothetical protein
MILDEHFQRIVVLSLPTAKERAERALDELRSKNLSEKAQVVRAVDGSICPPSDWWKAGGGAWGCMQSHYRVIQDALLDGIETLLVIEDDCVWQNSAARLAADFLAQVPKDWGQIYFGGQHRAARRPQSITPAVMKPYSVHRTHAYAIHRRIMPQVLKHILYAPDYIEAKEKEGFCSHVDHQLERAHRRGDWPVYCPSYWLAGQGANQSAINGRQHPDQWWHYVQGDEHRFLPVVICDREPTEDELRALHFGRHIDPNDPTVDVGVRDCATPRDLLRVMEVIAHEAVGGQRLAGIAGRDDFASWLEGWRGPVLRLSGKPDLDSLRDLPNSKVIHHEWFHPRVTVSQDEEPSESVAETIEQAKRPKVHQVWIGDAEMGPRLQGYCETVRRAFPNHDYKLWDERDMEELASRAVMPEVIRDRSFPLGLRSDVIRLEILRQHGGVYFDTDFEVLSESAEAVFLTESGFCYGDEKSGRPSNAMMAAPAGHPFVELYLRRIAASFRVPDDLWETVRITGPNKLAECLNFWTSEWEASSPLKLGDRQIGNRYAADSITAFWKEAFYPYHYKDGTWATFDPAEFPDALAAHHWEGGWNREPATTL